MRFERITADPAVCTGKHCIRGLRFPVSRLLGLLAAGETKETTLHAYPYLESEDVDEALRYGDDPERRRRDTVNRDEGTE